MTDLDKEIIIALADCNMNMTKVAREKYMHRNTVVYHVNRVKKLTGLDPMNFYDLHKLVSMIWVENGQDVKVILDRSWTKKSLRQ